MELRQHIGIASAAADVARYESDCQGGECRVLAKTILLLAADER
jgi:hypothetical protein